MCYCACFFFLLVYTLHGTQGGWDFARPDGFCLYKKRRGDGRKRQRRELRVGLNST